MNTTARHEHMFYSIYAGAMAALQSTLWGSGEIRNNPLTASWTQLDANSSFLHQHNWICGADDAFDRLIAGLRWGPAERRAMYDRVVAVPRLNLILPRDCFASARPGTASASVGRIVAETERLVGVDFAHAALNLYRNGRDSVAWHRDRIGRDRGSSVVALVSLGGPRLFRMRPFAGPDGRSEAPPSTRHDLTLNSGDLLVMSGAAQRDWEHSVPKAAVASPRISVVLRTKRYCEGPLFEVEGVTPLMSRCELQ